MIRYTLNSENLNRVSCSLCTIREVISSEDPDIKLTINRFNSLYCWNEMFDLQEVNNRINNGHEFYLFYFRNELAGHCWVDKRNQYTYCYNIFIDKTIHDKSIVDSTIYFVLLSDKLFDEGIESIQVEVDKWHKKSQDFCERIGFTICIK